MQANYVQRLRLTFSKLGPARFVGHLDLARTLERSLNRAEIPIAYTQGFNRRPRMAFAAPLPLGFCSEGELADLWLAEKMEPNLALKQMMQKMVPGIGISRVDDMPLRAPALQTITQAATYTVDLLDPLERADLAQRTRRVMSSKHLIQQRKKSKNKVEEYDLRPLIIDLHLSETTADLSSITMKLLLMPGKTGRPDEVLRAMDLDSYAARICRTKILLDHALLNG
jgi:radical SAM-linked protein